VVAAAVGAARAETTLGGLRAARRAAMRAAVLAKDPTGAPFGLLAIPVDFADLRFAAGFDPACDLAPRLGDDEEGALGHYVWAAANGRTRLVVVLAPKVSLAGERLDYSDLGWQGNERSRAMAAQALAGAALSGADFAAADCDQDGEVDGVLLLHAAPGLENDPGGLIVPQQYFLAAPVVQRGVLARSYAVVSAQSTLGIWAHETGHLLGLEDRYDSGLPASGETGARGGLGAFSLMAAGWLGSGEGEDPALPDAYSRLSLGWIDLGAEPTAAVAVRLAGDGPPGPEWFLAEVRDPAAQAPYDAVLPGRRLLIYHVDETLAEGEASAAAGPDRHLRVQLVEADGGQEVARGESPGAAGDLFPADGTAQAFNDGTVPSSRSWTGEPTGTSIAVAVDGTGALAFTNLAAGIWGDLRLRVHEAGGTFAIEAVLRLSRPVDPLPDVPFEVTVLDPTWGRFTDGLAFAGTFAGAALPAAWEDYAGVTTTWLAAGAPPPGAATPFAYTVGGGVWGTGELVHVWDPTWVDLSLDGDWPAGWSLTYPDGDAGTTWHRWPDGAPLGWPGAPLLACTGAEHTTAAAWPQVAYTNGARVRLLTPPLGTKVQWLELTHAVDLELLHPGTAIDGVALTWVQANGYEAPAVPADGWLGAVDPRARHALAGTPTFAVADSLEPDSSPLWRREVLPLPDPALHGPGPWRLGLELASNELWRARGWFVRDLAGHLAPVPASGFAVWLDADALCWTWPGESAPERVRVERSDDGGRTWLAVAERAGQDLADAGGSLPRDQLGLHPRVQSRLRVIALGPAAIASRAILAAAPPVVALGRPRPNPAAGTTWIDVDAADDPDAALAVFDLRGRLVRRLHARPGATVVAWDGRDDDGRRAGAGVYIFRLRAQGRILTSKVTWLP